MSVCLSVCLCVSAITQKRQVVTNSYFQKLLFCTQGRTSAMFYSHRIFGKYGKSNTVAAIIIEIHLPVPLPVPGQFQSRYFQITMASIWTCPYGSHSYLEIPGLELAWNWKWNWQMYFNNYSCYCKCVRHEQLSNL